MTLRKNRQSGGQCPCMAKMFGGMRTRRTNRKGTNRKGKNRKGTNRKVKGRRGTRKH